MPDDTPIKKSYTTLFEEVAPADLMVALAWLGVSILAIYLPVLNESPIRVVLTLPMILFLPGYCLIAALFCKEDDIDLIERIALSFGLSIAMVSLIGLGLNFTPWGIRLEPIVISLTLFTVVMVLIAHYRRTLLVPTERFRFPFFEIASTVRESFIPHEGSRIDRILTIILVVSVLIAVTTTIFVIAFPKQGERFTEFFILGENQTAAGYPDRINAGEQYPLYIGMVNHEYRPVTFTIRTYGMLMEFNTTTNASRIISMDPLWQHSRTLAHNETAIVPYNLSVNKSVYNRIGFLLFNESLPGPTVNSSDLINASFRDLHLIVEVRNTKYR